MVFFLEVTSDSHQSEKKNCPRALLTATSECDIKGQMTFYQNVNGDTWLTGTYQYGFQDPNNWNYDWTIQNGCGEILFNLTSWLDMEFVKDSGCCGYSSDNSKKTDNKKKGGYLNKRHKYTTFDEKCDIGPWGTKSWVIKVDELTWDCNQKGIKYKKCDKKDIYKDKVTDHDDEKLPNRLDDQGPTTGLYLIIDGENKSGKRDNSQSVTAININDYGEPVSSPPPSHTPQSPQTPPLHTPQPPPTLPPTSPQSQYPTTVEITKVTVTVTMTSKKPAFTRTE
ncbi:hypothetical protein F8M41_026339 [Gigaspora margarita]|uniref:Uncharacterized protein n=1 Tax=Gigaspora margarita TaxID=4874 RepID=A0A8H4ET29_GIGMA|nr:hypothetical protein F8M41_026339 [Gigaspora margarita]